MEQSKEEIYGKQNRNRPQNIFVISYNHVLSGMYQKLTTFGTPRKFYPILINLVSLEKRPLSVHNFKRSGSTPRGTIPDLWEYSRKSGIALLGVLPNPLKSYTGSTLGEYSRKSGIVLLGVLPQA